MSTLKFSENYHSYRSTAEPFSLARQPATPEQLAQQAILQAIESKMRQAHSLYLSRRYDAAYNTYSDASDMIKAQLMPNHPVGAGRWQIEKALSPHLFDALLGTGLEWMNVLPVRQPEIAARPRIGLDVSLLDNAASLVNLGIHSALLSNTKNAAALADWQLGQGYAAQGNQAQAKAFEMSARQRSPEVVGLLEQNENRNPPTTEQTLNSASGTILPPALMAQTRTLGVMLRGKVEQFKWTAGAAPPLEDIKHRIYKARIEITATEELFIPAIDASGVALNLPHYYYYVIPLSQGECSAATSAYARAEELYFRAAAYEFLNKKIEAPYIWQCLASLYLNWGNALYRQNEVADARGIYERLLTIEAGVPASALYTTSALTPGADIGRAIIADLALYLARADDPSIIVADLNPVIVADIMEVRQHLLKIEAGLDFWGNWHQSVPVWTFEYLQSVAVNFAQLAIGAERDFISFQSNSDDSALTREQLEQGVSQSRAEVNAATLASEAASAEVEVYTLGAALASKRALDSTANADEYAAMSADQIVRQAVAAQLAGGDDGDYNDLNSRADTMMGIGPTAQYMREHPGNWRMEGSSATLSATEQLVAARLNRQYEVDAMRRQAEEMAIARAQATAELTVAKARAAAAKAGIAVAQSRAKAAVQNLAAFDQQFFTPEVWRRMGDTMLHLYHRYFNMALKAARMMQQAYNFETDQALHMIKTDYGLDEVKGLLGADMLMADIQGFTYNLITTTLGKPQVVRQTISLAQRYGFSFENQLRRTGVMDFNTRIEDFDSVYPGTYAGRIEAVEVEVLGIVPPTGVSGTLTNSGISAFRTPASMWSEPSGSGIKYRVQSRETLVLSDYFARQDALLTSRDTRMSNIFQGAGLASAWRLEFPKAINDLDYGALTDVRLTFFYKARYDPDLHERVLAQLASRPGVQAGQRGIPLRWIYPDAFFRFQASGELRFTLRASDFRRNEQAPLLTDVGVLVVTDASIAPGALKVSLSTPAHPLPLLATTDADGAVAAGDPAWTALTGGSARGEYVVALTAADNPDLTGPGKRAAIINIALIIGYSFTPPV